MYLTIDSKVQRVAEDVARAGHPRRRGTLQNDHGVKDHFETLKAPAGRGGRARRDATARSSPTRASRRTRWTGGSAASARTHYDDRSTEGPCSDYPLLEPGDAGRVRAGLDVQARHLARDDARTASAASATTTPTTGTVRLDGTDFKNAGNGEVFGPVNLEQALTVSSDAYFYTVGDDFWHVWKQRRRARAGSASRPKARELGFGAPTGFELDEADGRVPDPKWKADVRRTRNYKTKQDQRRQQHLVPVRRHLPRGRPGRPRGHAAPARERVRRVRERRHAVAPARRARRSTDADGKPIDDVDAEARSAASTFDPTTRAAMLAGFRARSSNPKGTAYARVPGLPARPGADRGQDRYRAGRRARATRRCSSAMFRGTTRSRSTSWSWSSSRPGFGAQTAAPIARRIIETMNDLPTPPVRSIRPGPRLMAAASSGAGRAETSPWRHADFVLLALPFAITALGLLMIYSSSRTRLEEPGPEPAVLRRAAGPRDRARHRRDGDRARGRLPAAARPVGADLRRRAPAADRRAVRSASRQRARRRGSRSGRCSSSRRRSRRSSWSSRSPATAITIATISTPAGSRSRSRSRASRWRSCSCSTTSARRS